MAEQATAKSNGMNLESLQADAVKRVKVLVLASTMYNFGEGTDKVMGCNVFFSYLNGLEDDHSNGWVPVKMSSMGDMTPFQQLKPYHLPAYFEADQVDVVKKDSVKPHLSNFKFLARLEAAAGQQS